MDWNYLKLSLENWFLYSQVQWRRKAFSSGGPWYRRGPFLTCPVSTSGIFEGENKLGGGQTNLREPLNRRGPLWEQRVLFLTCPVSTSSILVAMLFLHFYSFSLEPLQDFWAGEQNDMFAPQLRGLGVCSCLSCPPPPSSAAPAQVAIFRVKSDRIGYTFSN